VSDAVGVDVGGTGIKGAVVDVDTGELLSERVRIETPRPATPEAVRDTIGELVDVLASDGPVGVALPAVINHGVVRTAANIDPAWIGTSLPELFTGIAAGAFLNDADAQAVAEFAYGAARGEDGLIITVTFGTGIGVGLIHDGTLIPNAELGHVELDGVEAEYSTNARAREDAGMSWEEWGVMASRYLQHLENLLWPELFVIGGGLAKKPDLWLPHFRTRTPLRPAALINNAGIVGAAHAAAQTNKQA
jgi:polyphosphate glucokinase